jgi:D-alanyl-lipoteichoic acid acyltransferase DltB (MBOAT superfamily)
MIFSSVEFIFIFLPITAVLFALMRRFAGVGAALGVLTAASIVFYGVWRPQDVPLLVGSIIVNWLLSTLIEPARVAGEDVSSPAAPAGPFARWIKPSRSLSWAALCVGVIGNVALLFWFKYAVFASTVATQAGLLNHPLAAKLLPLGISFFTFVQIAYLIDRYKGLAPLAGFWRYLLFVSFFPHLIAGPIVHHASMMPQLEHPKPTAQTFALALFIFAVGLAKKTLLADPLGEVADFWFDPHHVNGLATLNAWGVVICYTMQLYFDFSGYSDMAIGLALMFGVQFPWNFLSPYKSTSISQFWRNWHITLSNFLKDYVYIPLGGSRVGKWRNAGNLMATMLIGGIWHGAGWPFILWGGLHGIALVINHRWSAMKLVMPAIFGWALTTATIVAGWVLFRAKSFGDAAAFYRSMLGHGTVGRVTYDGTLVTALPYLLLAIFIALLLPNTKQLSERFRPNVTWALGTSVLMGLAMMFILGKVAPPEFLYYQF